MKIHLKIKFRAFFITFAQVDETYDLARLGIVVPSIGQHTLYSKSGILLELL